MVCSGLVRRFYTLFLLPRLIHSSLQFLRCLVVCETMYQATLYSGCTLSIDDFSAEEKWIVGRLVVEFGRNFE
jgi:hypothetical protein